VVWGQEDHRSLDWLLGRSERRRAQATKLPTKQARAAEWLHVYLNDQPTKRARSDDAKIEGKRSGHEEWNLQRAISDSEDITIDRVDGDRNLTWWVLTPPEAATNRN